MNKEPDYINRRHEANLFILGNISEDLAILKEKNRLTKDDINSLMKFLFGVLNEHKKSNNI